MLLGVCTSCGGDDSAPADSEEAAASDTQSADAPSADSADDQTAATATDPAEGASGDTGMTAELLGVTIIEFEGGGHVEGFVEYNSDPPVGGDHNRGWQNCGFYAVELPNEQAVHSLEHGAIWITWAPDVEDSVVEAIESYANDNPFVLASPYSLQSEPIALSAWGRQATVDSFDDPLVQSFYDTYAGADSPVAPEPGALCEGAFGIPPNDTQTIS